MLEDYSFLTEPAKKPLKIYRILAVLGLLLIIGMAVKIGTYTNAANQLKVSIQYDESQLRITNNDNFEWKDVRLVIIAYSSDYKLNIPNIMPHAEMSMNLNQFAKDDGTKFEPSYLHQSEFYINAQVGNDQWSSWNYKFD
jgi:hypothetical protein